MTVPAGFANRVSYRGFDIVGKFFPSDYCRNDNEQRIQHMHRRSYPSDAEYPHWCLQSDPLLAPVKRYQIRILLCPLRNMCKKEPSLFKKSQQITFKSDEGKEYHFTFEKSIKLLEGHRYELYFRKNSSSTESIDSSAPDLLGFEEIVKQLQKQTKSNE